MLAEIDRHIREEFWDPKLKGVDWSAAVARAADELARAATDAERDAVYDRLLATLDDSHTFRVPAGRLPRDGLGARPDCGSAATATATRSRDFFPAAPRSARA